jgi:hypothetical protein
VTPDFFEGQVSEHYSQGISLVRRAPAYVTNITAPQSLPNLGGASGGPLIAEKDFRVYGLMSTSSENHDSGEGFDTSKASFPYVAVWANRELDEDPLKMIAASGQRITQPATRILDAPCAESKAPGHSDAVA